MGSNVQDDQSVISLLVLQVMANYAEYDSGNASTALPQMLMAKSNAAIPKVYA